MYVCICVCICICYGWLVVWSSSALQVQEGQAEESSQVGYQPRPGGGGSPREGLLNLRGRELKGAGVRSGHFHGESKIREQGST